MQRALLIVLAACKTEVDDSGPFPIHPGGNGGGGGISLPDAALDAPGDDATTAALSGRVCLHTDVRDPASCAAGPSASGLTVTVGNELATTSDGGNFTIARPTGDQLVWRVTGATIVTSVIPFGPSFELPAVSTALYEDLLVTNGQLFVADGQGSLIARVLSGGAGVADATGTLGVAQNGPTYYDSNNPTTWDQDATGTFGVVWMPVELVGTYTLTVTPPLAVPVTSIVTIEERSITFATVDVP